MSKLFLPIDEKRDHIKGARSAHVTFLEYGDFECPYCGRAYFIVKQLEDEMGLDLRIVFRNFPLSQIHPHAMSAALASESAGKQKKFWAMHDKLFENQDALEDEDIVNYAGGLELNLERFVSDMASSSTQSKIREDVMSGIRSGVNGTPTFFINGYRYDGALEFDALRGAILRAEGARL